MSQKYKEYTNLNLPNVAEEVLVKWKKNNTFQNSIDTRSENKPYIFFEGPPSANGMPGIHHVMGRAIKDIFCRYKTLQGFRVERKAGWDTHGLPVELGVEKELGITKEDIGTKISVEEYNDACRKAVMKYTDVWNDLTEKMGYWVDMENPYVTYDNKYIESVWWLLSEIYKKDLMYKGYTIQPYSPAAGTGLSSHEINQPGCYRDVKDRTAVVMFKILKSTENFDAKKNINTADFNVMYDNIIIESEDFSNVDTYLLAWTTTPWTLPSNTALAVGEKISYLEVVIPYNSKLIKVIVASDLFSNYFNVNNVNPLPSVGNYKFSTENMTLEDLLDKEGNSISKKVPSWIITGEYKGIDLKGLIYEQLLPFAKPDYGKAFEVILGDFVTTTDGTGIVHIAPSFGSDDFRVAKQNNIGFLTLVDSRGKFLPIVNDGVFLYGEEFVKEAFLEEDEKLKWFNYQKEILENNGIIKDLKTYLSVDERIVLRLQNEGKLFKKEIYEHSYPHCWRTDKPVLYYPLDSWFIKITDERVKTQLVALNKTINWKPESTGTGRFGNWLENANDWNLSRSRFWGIPIPIWKTEDGNEMICIASVEQLKVEIEKSIKAGFMTSSPLAQFNIGDFSKENYNSFDLHKNYVDAVILCSASGKPMHREADLIDVWFDSGAMPIAQHHYPFENKELIDSKGLAQADFIAEGVDQTRGWFYTLHAISTMVFDRVAYKNVISNGLVLDKNGQKMSKRLGNAVDPFETLKKYGADATRWYMITNAQPWDNLKFDADGIVEVQRKFFGTLYNTYNGFLAVYANIDNFTYSEAEIPYNQRPEIDRWVLSRLNSLIKEVEKAYEEYEPTKAGRMIQDFVCDELSNWYVRLCRRRFWKGEYTEDKISAYQTLYTCLEKVAILSSPIAPFYMDQLFGDLNDVTKKHSVNSVHLAQFPNADESQIDLDLEHKMDIAQRTSSLVLSLRKREKLKVRQPLQRIMIPALDKKFVDAVLAVKELILSEVNVKELELIDDTSGILSKRIKPNFKTIGKKYGQQMKAISTMVAGLSQQDIAAIEKQQGWNGKLDGVEVDLTLEDFEIIADDIPGWMVAVEGNLTVALDVTLNAELIEEGLAREFVNRIQNLRKDNGYEVTDRILLTIKSDDKINEAIKNNLIYICSETLADSLQLVDSIEGNKTIVEIDETISTEIGITKTELN